MTLSQQIQDNVQRAQKFILDKLEEILIPY